MREVDVTGTRKTYDFLDVFVADEIVKAWLYPVDVDTPKVYCMFSDEETGELRWSLFRGLEEG